MNVHKRNLLVARSERILIITTAWLLIIGCATFRSGTEMPTVNVSSIRALPSEGIAPRFEIGLHIINPNRSPLKLRGIAYTLSLEGHKLVTGVANDLPIIDGYGEGDVTLVASTSLLSSIRFFTDLVNTQRDAITYELNAKLDLGGFRPAMHVGEKGEIRLAGQTP